MIIHNVLDDYVIQEILYCSSQILNHETIKSFHDKLLEQINYYYDNYYRLYYKYLSKNC